MAEVCKCTQDLIGLWTKIGNGWNCSRS